MQKLRSNTTDSRSGVTLTEVLMSLMIMAIGVTSVITLFPIATLRSAQATKLTNAAILKYDLDAQLQIQPELIFDPDGDGNLNEHFNSPSSRNYIVDPTGHPNILELSRDEGRQVDPTNNTRLTADYFGHFASTGAVSGLRRFGGGVWSSLEGGLDDANRVGRAATLSDDELRALRIAGETVASLGDNWETLYDFVPDQLADAASTVIANGAADSSAVISGIVIPTDVIGDAASADLIETSQKVLTDSSGLRIPIRDPERMRITVFSTNGEFSHSFPLLAIDTTTLIATWSEELVGADFNLDGQIESRGLPRELLVGTNWQIGRVLIQQQKSVDFTWLLTVRRAADGRVKSMDAVIRFGEPINLENERLHPVTITEDLNGNGTFDAGEDLDGDGFFDVIERDTNSNGVLDNGEDLNGNGVLDIRAFVDTRVFVNTTLEPALRKGGYVFDVTNARWHRIRNWGDAEQPGWSWLNLEVPYAEFATPTASGAGLVLPGVIDVFPMGSRSIPESVRRGF